MDEADDRRSEPPRPPEQEDGDLAHVLDELEDLWTVDVDGVEMAVRFRP
jgi:hypothetical protein